MFEIVMIINNPDGTQDVKPLELSYTDKAACEIDAATLNAQNQTPVMSFECRAASDNPSR